MRISDWSSDVCSSDLQAGREDEERAERPLEGDVRVDERGRARAHGQDQAQGQARAQVEILSRRAGSAGVAGAVGSTRVRHLTSGFDHERAGYSGAWCMAERSGGVEGGGQVGYLWRAYRSKKKQ